MKKRFLSFALAVVLAVSLVPGTALGATVVDSGYCGVENEYDDDGNIINSNLTWALDSDGVLTISGLGEMRDYFNGAPWEAPRYSVNTVIVKDGVTSIGRDAFMNCLELTYVDIPNSVANISRGAFCNCSKLTRIDIPDSITRIEPFTFEDCDCLTIVNLPDSVTNIGGGAFRGCSSLTYLPIPSGITRIENGTFADCDGLKKITIPNHITSVGAGIFDYCDNLTEVIIPSSVVDIAEAPFSGYCINLKRIIVDENNPKYCSVNGVLFNKEKTNILQFPGGFTGEYSIPDSVTSIEKEFQYCRLRTVILPDGFTCVPEDAFFQCNELVEVRLPNSILSIDGGAFIGCTSLASIDIPDNVTYIGSSAFLFCSNLTSVTIPDSVTCIGGGAFEQCSGLTNIIIPSSVTSIHGRAFEECYNLSDVYYAGSKEQWDKIDISDYGNECLTGAKIHFNASPTYPSTYIATIPFLIGTGGDGKSMPKTATVSGTFWNDEWFFEPSTTYNHELARTAITLSNAAYVLDDKDKGINGEENMKGLLTQFGFDEDAISWNRIKPTAEDNDTVSFTLAAKKLNGGDGSQPTLILIDIKGTSSDEEWYSNFNVGQTTNEHVGFLDAKILVISRLASFFQSLQEANYQLGADTKFLVTGHSRGAASQVRICV